MTSTLNRILSKAVDGQRLTFDEGVALFECKDLNALGRTADAVSRWLHPEPSWPFVDLTAAVVGRYPDHPPYEGAHDEIVPHLTITAQDVPVPIATRAREVQLIEEREADGRWTVRLTIPMAS